MLFSVNRLVSDWLSNINVHRVGGVREGGPLLCSEQLWFESAEMKSSEHRGVRLLCEIHILVKRTAPGLYISSVYTFEHRPLCLYSICTLINLQLFSPTLSPLCVLLPHFCSILLFCTSSDYVSVFSSHVYLLLSSTDTSTRISLSLFSVSGT